MNSLRLRASVAFSLGLGFTWVCLTALAADPPDVLYDESKVPNDPLPELLIRGDGTRVRDAQDWRTARRPEIVRLFEEHVYGRSPKPTNAITYEVTSLDRQALGGKATRK